MTVEMCASKAAAAGATYFGVEYYGECYWGNSINSVSTQQDANLCTAWCAGNQQEACGGLTGQMGLYANPSNVVPKEVSSYKTWVTQGCYSDSAGARSLPNTYTAPSGTSMTVEVCCDAAAGFKYAAVEYGKECYYGNYLAPTASKEDSGCDMQCAGSPSELCGGGNRINLYLNNAYSQPASEKPSVGPFSSLGCYTDSESARGLTAGSSKSPSMTVEKCVQLAAGYKYAAMEYSTECYWGNTLSSTSTQASGQCTMACGGDAKELCGDGNRMNVY
ncbi:WSC-domain-containing protein, partial [Hypoxylon sp. EC38]